jgi:putative restriction endonuclease
VRFYVGVTDFEWFRFLAARPNVDEVNFWQPSGGRPFKALRPGELFLFKLHSPRNFIVGGGFFAHWSALPVSMAWDAFGEKNGAGSLEEIRIRLAKYRNVRDDPRADYQIGCILLEQPFFLPEPQWIPAPANWSRNIVQGKGYAGTEAEASEVLSRLGASSLFGVASEARVTPERPFIEGERFGKPTVVLPRLGQGSFRVLVTDIYERRCAITGERTLPVLQAAHIKPYGQDGPHHPRNGLLLRSDLHTLFDRGYVTVTPERRFEVSRRIRDEFENGRDYYALHGKDVRAPARAEYEPSPEYLDWHASNVFRG